MAKILFPNNFIWGSATASYQIEGAPYEDGKGESIWDRFSHTPGKINNNDTGDIACDHYHRYPQDIKLMKEIGLKSYRYSISWPRILPEGKGKINQKGLDYYKRLTDLLLQNEIEPCVTLYHWDLPQKLQDIGGWCNRDLTDYFTDYAGIIFKSLGDVVKTWITHNEPWVVSFLGNMYGMHAPGIKDLKTTLDVGHNLLLSHGKTVMLYRELNSNGKIGISLNMSTKYPASQKPEDIKAAQISDGIVNRWFLDPILKKNYPEDIMMYYMDEEANFTFPQEDMKIIGQPIDFIGINYYTSEFVECTNDNGYQQCAEKMKDFKRTDMDWIIHPQALYDLLMGIKKDYGDIELIISENGAAFKDTVTSSGTVEDIQRTNYLHDHLLEAHRAISDGVNLKGYYLWSLMDNFEWSFGYDKRFGIIHVDYDSQKRIIKNSGLWYKNTIINNGF